MRSGVLWNCRGAGIGGGEDGIGGRGGSGKVFQRVFYAGEEGCGGGLCCSWMGVMGIYMVVRFCEDAVRAVM
jgi:hypothetical protein